MPGARELVVVEEVPAELGVVLMFCPLILKTMVPLEPGATCAVKVMGVRAGAGLRLEVRLMAAELCVMMTATVLQVAGAKVELPE